MEHPHSRFCRVVVTHLPLRAPPILWCAPGAMTLTVGDWCAIALTVFLGVALQAVFLTRYLDRKTTQAPQQPQNDTAANRALSSASQMAPSGSDSGSGAAGVPGVENATSGTSDTTGAASAEEAESPPPEFLCPITMELMRDPVCTVDGHCYEVGGPSTGAVTMWSEWHHAHARSRRVALWNSKDGARRRGGLFVGVVLALVFPRFNTHARTCRTVVLRACRDRAVADCSQRRRRRRWWRAAPQPSHRRGAQLSRARAEPRGGYRSRAWFFVTFRRHRRSCVTF